jgi:hypothetical protein
VSKAILLSPARGGDVPDDGEMPRIVEELTALRVSRGPLTETQRLLVLLAVAEEIITENEALALLEVDWLELRQMRLDLAGAAHRFCAAWYRWLTCQDVPVTLLGDRSEDVDRNVGDRSDEGEESEASVA